MAASSTDCKPAHELIGRAGDAGGGCEDDGAVVCYHRCVIGAAGETQARAIRDAIRSAAARPEVRDAVQQIYDRLVAQVAQRRPVCEMSGRCCRFEEFGHRLFVTTIELAAFVHGLELDGRRTLAGAVEGWTGRGCPFQESRLCGVHAIRPFGCRIFFCDPTATSWQNDLYEGHHADLKRLHERLGVPYYYLEWRQALAIFNANAAPERV